MISGFLSGTLSFFVVNVAMVPLYFYLFFKYLPIDFFYTALLLSVYFLLNFSYLILATVLLMEHFL